MPQNIGENQNAFGIGGILMLNASTRALVASAPLTGAIEIDATAELSTTMGGAANMAVAARMKRRAATIKITLNGLSPALQAALMNGVESSIAAAAAGVVSSPVNSAAGVVPSSNLTVGILNSGANGVLTAVAKSATVITVAFVGENGIIDEQDIDTAVTATTNLANAGVALDVNANTAQAMVVGSVSEWQISAVHGGVSVVSLPLFAATAEYRIAAVSRKGGETDVVRQIIVPRCVFGGYTTKLTDDEVDNSGIEISGVILAPVDGSAPYETRIVSPA